MTTLAERLGFQADDRLLIVNCDDLGSSQAANTAVYDALRNGVGTSASLMVPCPWARGAAAEYRGEDVGVHLTLNAEWDLYRWGPITQAPSLLDGDGGFPRTITDVFEHADLDEVRRELRAQMERAILWGFDVSHLDAHMLTLQLRPEFFDVYLDLAVEFRLPLRMVGRRAEEFLGFPARQVAAEAGAVFTDELILVAGVGSREVIASRLARLKPGVTEMYVHPAVDSPELRAIAGDADLRIDDYDLVCTDGTLRQMVDDAGASLIGYRALRDLAREGG